MSFNEEHQNLSGVYHADWFQRYEQELKTRDTVSFQSVSPYIFFKLAHDFAFSRSNSIDLHDPLAINYFMGNFCYNQVVKDFDRSAIVMQSLTERIYFGSSSVSQKRMRIYSSEMGKSVGDFDAFICYLEEKVLQSRLPNLDKSQKETLGMILRIINQGVSAIAIKMLNAYLQVRSGESDSGSSDGFNDICYLMRPDKSTEKGSTQIDILYDGDGKIQLYRREYLKVQKLDIESLVQPDNAKYERWCLMTLLSRNATDESSDWRLHFSVSKIQNYCQSPNKATQLGPVSSDVRLCHSDQSTSSGGSPVSIDTLSSSVENAENEISHVRPKRRRRRRPLRDLLFRRKTSRFRLVPTPNGSHDTISRNSSTYFPSDRTDDSPEGSPSVCLIDVDELKENEPAHLPHRQSGIVSDELRNDSESEAVTVRNRKLAELNAIAILHWI